MLTFMLTLTVTLASALTETTTEPSTAEPSTAEPCPQKVLPKELNLTEIPLSPLEMVYLVDLAWSQPLDKETVDMTYSPTSLKWRLGPLKDIFEIAQHVCGSAVPEAFFYYSLNYFIIWYNNTVHDRAREESEFWKKQKEMTSTCKTNVTSSEPKATFDFLTTADRVLAYSWNETEHRISIPEEYPDKKESKMVLDYPIDAVWFMFLTFTSSCYHTVNRKTSWLAELHFNFRKDFVQDLEYMWKHTRIPNFGILYGDIDLDIALHNLKACAVASHHRANILDRMFLRPITVSDKKSYFLQNWNSRRSPIQLF